MVKKNNNKNNNNNSSNSLVFGRWPPTKRKAAATIYLKLMASGMPIIKEIVQMTAMTTAAFVFLD